ncbi:MAG: hypothetical protein WCV82_02830 [Candidatus Paceibacterota bacterium]
MSQENYNKQKFKEYLLDLSVQSTRDKFAILPILSGLMIALLALGSAGDLFSVTITIKYLATILLLLMILSLQIYYSETIGLNTKAMKELNALNNVNKDVSLNLKQSIWYLLSGRIRGEKHESDFFDRFTSQFPAYAILVLWFVVLMMIWEIWK